MSDQTGGPAFPAWSTKEPFFIQGGMSLRDYFAAMNLPVDENGDWLGWFTGKPIVEAFGKCPEANGLEQLEWLAMVEAKIRYMRADAMLAERERKST